MKKVLFVCLGNICRSPMAEGVFKELVSKNGLSEQFEVDSAGTGAYHIGKLPDPRMMETAKFHGINLTSKARQVHQSDFTKFDFIVAMDKSNYHDLLANAPDDATAKIVMMRKFDPNPEDGNVPDPYYGGVEGFENVYQILTRSCEKFLESIQSK